MFQAAVTAPSCMPTVILYRLYSSWPRPCGISTDADRPTLVDRHRSSGHQPDSSGSVAAARTNVVATALIEWKPGTARPVWLPPDILTSARSVDGQLRSRPPSPSLTVLNRHRPELRWTSSPRRHERAPDHGFP